jgi:hypothetical protein
VVYGGLNCGSYDCIYLSHSAILFHSDSLIGVYGSFFSVNYKLINNLINSTSDSLG